MNGWPLDEWPRLGEPLELVPLSLHSAQKAPALGSLCPRAGHCAQLSIVQTDVHVAETAKGNHI